MPGLGQSGYPYPGIAFKDLPLAWEQMRNFGGGEDSYDDPIDLQPTVSQRMINMIVRDKLKAGTRYGADPINGAGSAAPGGAFPLQGLYWFSNANYSLLLAAMNGKLYKYDGNVFTLLGGYTLQNGAVPFEAAQGLNQMLLSDGVNALQTFDGVNFVSCGLDPNTSPPPGVTSLMWHTGRMFAAGVPAYNDTIWVSNRLAFGAAQWNWTTRSFRVSGGDNDPIVGMTTGWGYYAVILKTNSIWYLYTDPTQEPVNFQATQDVQTVTDGIGCVGRKAWCRYANDVMFMARDGVRSVQRMVAAEAQYQVSPPLSRPIQFWIDQINWQYANTIVATKYLEFALWAVPLGTAQTPNAVLVWNGLLGVWLGCWQGWTPTCFALPRFNGIQRLAFGDGAGFVNQWKDLSATNLDATYLDNTAPIASTLYTRSMTFQDLESPKVGFNAHFRFNQGNATINFAAIGDDAPLSTYVGNVGPSGSLLGVGVLGNFLLASQNPSLVPVSLRGNPAFNELYFQITSPSGWWQIRNLTAGARVRPMKIK